MNIEHQFVKKLPNLLLCTACLMPSLSFAEVTSLSSSELTETYIKDSTIIVTPKKQATTQQKTYSSLTIAPIENNDQDISELQNFQNQVQDVHFICLMNLQLVYIFMM